MAPKKNVFQRSGMIWMIFLPLLLVSAWLLFQARIIVFHHLRSQSWEPAQATVLERGVDREKSSGGGNEIAAAARFTGKFSYAWKGLTYESTQVSFSYAKSRSVGQTFDDWDERLDKVLGEVGGVLTVWVNPREPREAVALRDLRWSEIGLMLVFGLALLWISSVFLFGMDVHTANAEFSWRTVSIMWVVGAYLGVLVPLLWRDGHPVWAVVAALPLLLAIKGTVHGLRL